MCSLSKSCSDSSYTDLWSYFFKLRFDTLTDLYTTVNIGSFAIDNTVRGTCDLYIQMNNSDDSKVTLGSMFLQNFVTLFS